MVFSQLMDLVSATAFKRSVEKYRGNYKVRELTCWRQFLILSFGQLTHRESMRDTHTCLRLHAEKLYHLGVGKLVDVSTISRANETRDWRIYQDFGLKLIRQAKELYAGTNQLDVELKGDIFAMDSTTIDLCLEVFWWADFRETKAAIKLHTMLDLKTSIPDFVSITNAAVHDVNIMDIITYQKGSYYVMDKAYADFKRLHRIKREQAYFVTRAKDNLQFEVINARTPDSMASILSDQDIRLAVAKSATAYPDKLRRIKYFDAEYNRILVFLTNNFSVKAETIAKLYKHRWYIEIFFKWIKQHLKIKSFWGQNENAVKTQIWVAISIYVLVAIAKKKLEIRHSLYELLQFISVSPFERTPLHSVFMDLESRQKTAANDNQLTFNLQ